MTRTNEILETLMLMHKEGDYYSMAAEELKTELRQLRKVLENKVWKSRDKDSKGKVDGKRYIMYMTEKGTTYGPLSGISNDRLKRFSQ